MIFNWSFVQKAPAVPPWVFRTGSLLPVWRECGNYFEDCGEVGQLYALDAAASLARVD